MSEQTVSKEAIKELREKSGAGLVECKQALRESNGDVDRAMDLLREKGLASAAKKSGRAASEGVVSIAASKDENFYAIYEVNCETDFVTNTDDFKDLVESIGEVALESGAKDLDSLKNAKVAKADNVSVQDWISQKIAIIGENLVLRKYDAVEKTGSAYISQYIHGDGKIGVLLELEAEDTSKYSNEAFQNLAKDISMHIAASAPVCLDRSQVNPEDLNKERAIYKKQVLEEGKPENIADKIVEGKLNKYYEEICLVDQEFIKENKVKISQVVDREAKAIGSKIILKNFIRIALGAE